MTSRDDDATRPIGAGDDLDDAETTRAYDPFAEETTVAGGEERTRRMDLPADAPVTESTRVMQPAGVPTAGPVTERIAVAAQRDLSGWLVALAIVVALAVGAAVGFAQSDGNDNGIVARKLVGAQGGVLDFGKIGKVEIPAEALPTPTAITVRKVSNENRVRLGAEGDVGTKLYEPGELQMYAFEPADLRFQKPVKITIPRPNRGEALLVDTPDGARVVAGEIKGDSATIETQSFAFDQ